jgi:hypothetical protein
LEFFDDSCVHQCFDCYCLVRVQNALLDIVVDRLEVHIVISLDRTSLWLFSYFLITRPYLGSLF